MGCANSAESTVSRRSNGENVSSPIVEVIMADELEASTSEYVSESEDVAPQVQPGDYSSWFSGSRSGAECSGLGASASITLTASVTSHASSQGPAPVVPQAPGSPFVATDFHLETGRQFQNPLARSPTGGSLDSSTSSRPDNSRVFASASLTRSHLSPSQTTPNTSFFSSGGVSVRSTDGQISKLTEEEWHLIDGLQRRETIGELCAEPDDPNWWREVYEQQIRIQNLRKQLGDLQQLERVD